MLGYKYPDWENICKSDNIRYGIQVSGVIIIKRDGMAQAMPPPEYDIELSIICSPAQDSQC